MAESEPNRSGLYGAAIASGALHACRVYEISVVNGKVYKSLGNGDYDDTSALYSAKFKDQEDALAKPTEWRWVEFEQPDDERYSVYSTLRRITGLDTKVTTGGMS